MKYNLMQIIPAFNNGESSWIVQNTKLDSYRNDNDVTKPNASGYYFYPETMTSHEAFERLRKRMAQAHEGSIRKTIARLNRLNELQFEADEPCFDEEE